MREIVVKGEDSKPDSSISQIIDYAQDRQHTFLTGALDVSMIDEREIKFSLISGTMYLYTRKEGTLYRVALTAV